MSPHGSTLSARLQVVPQHRARLERELAGLAAEAERLPQVGGTEMLVNRGQGELLLLVRVRPGGEQALEPLLSVLNGLWMQGLLERDPHLEIWEPVQRRQRSVQQAGLEPAPEEASSPAAEGLFDLGRLGPLVASNRILRSATWEGLAAEDGSVSDALVELYVSLAAHGVGVVVSGHTFVSPEGRAGPRQMGAHTDDMLPGLTRLAADTRQAGAAVVLQLAHAGCNARSPQEGVTVMGPSQGAGDLGVPCAEMTPGDIRRVTLDFAKAAVRAQQAGFDGVQLHAAHGYLLSQFLSPACNRRTDKYGGSLEARARLLLEATELIRDAVGDGFAVLAKMNVEDFREDGLTLEESLQVAQWLQESGLDGLELSGGTLASGEYTPLRGASLTTGPAYYLEQARQFRQRLSLPLVLTGGVRTLAAARQALQVADFVGLSRPLICSPDIPALWRQEHEPDPACTSCNLCLKHALGGRGLVCAQKEGADAGFD